MRQRMEKRQLKNAFSKHLQFGNWNSVLLGSLKDGVEHNLVSAQPRGKQVGISVYQLLIHLWLKLASGENHSRAFLACLICKVSLFSEEKKKKSPQPPESQVFTDSCLRVWRWRLSEHMQGQMKLSNQPKQG